MVISTYNQCLTMRRKLIICTLCWYITVILIIELQNRIQYIRVINVLHEDTKDDSSLATTTNQKHSEYFDGGLWYNENPAETTCKPAFENNKGCSSFISEPFKTDVSIKDTSDTCKLEIIVNDCKAFKEWYGYDSIPITKEEQAFPIAFGIKIHHLVEQAELLLRTIYREHNVYCVHVDKRSSADIFRIMNKISGCFNNIIVIQNRENIVDSSFAVVKSELKCMSALSNSKVRWKYYINVDGQDFPLRTNLEMVNILKNLNGINDLETYDHPIYLNWNIENSFSVVGNSLAEESKKSKFKYKLRFSKGNPFGLFAKDFVNFILNDDIAEEIINWLNDTYAPAENVWATLVTLPWAPGNYPVEVRHMVNGLASRAMVLATDSTLCRGRLFGGICNYACGDIPWLKFRPEFFASIFDSAKEPEVLTSLKQWYTQKAQNPKLTDIDFNFYNNLPHVKRNKRKAKFPMSESERYSIKQEWIAKTLIV